MSLSSQASYHHPLELWHHEINTLTEADGRVIHNTQPAMRLRTRSRCLHNMLETTSPPSSSVIHISPHGSQIRGQARFPAGSSCIRIECEGFQVARQYGHGP